MNSPIPFDANRFRSAASHYAAGRPPYPPRLLARVAVLCGIGDGSRVLDLGCGPAPLGVAFARMGCRVTAVDPSPEMLAEAGRAAQAAGVELRLAEGSSYALTPGLGTFDLVAIGRAFHWMDRPRTLAALDAMVAPGGTVALFGSSHPEVPDNAWRETYNELADRHAGAGEARAVRRGPGWVRDEAVLLASPFRVLERVSAIERTATPLSLFGRRILSMSSTSHARIGDAADRLAQEVVEVLGRFAEDGAVTEVVESTALLARRS